MRIDLHTHTLFSDGDLLPSELVARAKAAGYDAIALTDHVDFTNIDHVVPRILRAVEELSRHYRIKTFAGCEITYVPPALISKAVRLARRCGARVVVVHGQTPVEPVPEGTNRAGILSGADILAHPGFISDADARLAAEKNICLEITTRHGHDGGNPCVARLARKYGARLVLNTDTHSPENLLDDAKVRAALKKSSLTAGDYEKMTKNSAAVIGKAKKR